MDNIHSTLVGGQARKKIAAGVRKIVEAISPTLGPKGRAAIMPRSYNRGPRIADDGYYVAENVILKDEHERAAADAFKEAIQLTNQKVGDGTTTTGVIAGHLIKTYLPVDDVPSAGKKTDVIDTVNSLKEAAAQVISEIKEKAKSVKTQAELKKIASIAVKHEELAEKISKLVWEVARDEKGNYVDNNIVVTEGYKGEIETEVIRGMKFPAKAIRNFLTNMEKLEMVAEDVPILITNYKLNNPYEVIEILNTLKIPKLAIFAPEFSTGVIQSLIKTAQNGLFVYPVHCPAVRTDFLEDIAAYTGARVIDKDTGAKLSNVNSNDIGFAEKVIVKYSTEREDAVLLGGRGEKLRRGTETVVTDRIAVLKKQTREVKNDLAKMQLEQRIANLSSAVGVVRVGASSDKEAMYLRLKAEDGVGACRAALEEGYVQGGGMCLKSIAEKTKTPLSDALKAPYELIKVNCGGTFEPDKDVIDPAKVVRLCVEHAVSVASTMLTTEVSIAEVREKSPGEGYGEIADAIRLYAHYDARHKGLIKENEDYKMEAMEKQFEQAIHNDLG